MALRHKDNQSIRINENETNYHDYVIKDGLFIGEFERMYEDCDDPWHQTELKWHKLSFSRNIAILNMKRLNIESIIEFGCGFGFFTNMIKESMINVKGVDISPRAISKAENLFPKIDFSVNTIQNMLETQKEVCMKYDAFLLSEITWYILSDIDMIIKNLKEFSGKYLINDLIFYKGKQKYGTEYFTTLDEFIDFIPFDCIARSESTSKNEGGIETCTVFKI